MPKADGSPTTTERGLGWDFERHARPLRRAAVGQPCPRCGVVMVPAHLQTSRSVTVDHALPRALGGSNDPSNLRVLCRRCNCGMGGRLGTSRRVRRARVIRLVTTRSW